MPKCSYCEEDYGVPKGMTLVKTDGTIVHLCSSKCRKNMLMKRRKVRWISKTKKVAPLGVSPKGTRPQKLELGGKKVEKKSVKEEERKDSSKKEVESKK
jgi:large subunit ribosomal protein L24e